MSLPVTCPALGSAACAAAIVVPILPGEAADTLSDPRERWLPGWLDRRLPDVPLEGHLVEGLDERVPSEPERVKAPAQRGSFPRLKLLVRERAATVARRAVGRGQPGRAAPARPRRHDVTSAEGDPDAPVLRDAVVEVHAPIVRGRLRRRPPG